MAQLKISDLSVGDWVQDILGNICIIRNIFCGDLVECYVVEKGDELGIMIDRLRPIPITAELLEKNGAKKTEFVKDSGYEFYQCDDLYASRVEGSEWWTIIVRKEYREVVKCYVQHVHQMQHALRLAGVEKEIEL